MILGQKFKPTQVCIREGTYIRVGKKDLWSLGAESLCIVASFPFTKIILLLGDHFVKRTACHNTLQRSIFTSSKTNCQILHQKVNQRISGMKTNNGVFVVFKTKYESKCQFSGNTSPLQRFFDKFFDVIFDNPFLTLQKYCFTVSQRIY